VNETLGTHPGELSESSRPADIFSISQLPLHQSKDYGTPFALRAAEPTLVPPIPSASGGVSASPVGDDGNKASPAVDTPFGGITWSPYDATKRKRTPENPQPEPDPEVELATAGEIYKQQLSHAVQRLFLFRQA
jgi:hypothetical protein